jgi:OPT family oligopeptide transporter
MQVYPEVPVWWYIAVGVISLALLLVSIEVFPTQLPIWGALFAFGLAVFFSLPLAMLQAITNRQLSLNILHEMIGGYLIRDRPIANMIFKAIAYIGTNQAVGFAGDLKLGHYMKIPPRMMFMVQVVAAFVSCIVCVLIQDWMFANVVDFCTPHQPGRFVCPSTNTFATASLVWGGIGPARFLSPGKL